MAEERMAGLVQGALADAGINDEVLAAGQFNPRGQSGGMFAGGLVRSRACLPGPSSPSNGSSARQL